MPILSSSDPYLTHPSAGAWEFNEDFTAYAVVGDMTTAGYTLINANHALDAANDEWDMVGNGNSDAGTALGFTLENSTSYTIEVDIVNWTADPLTLRLIGGTIGDVQLFTDGSGGTKRFDMTTGTSNTRIRFDSNAATSLSISGWRIAKASEAPPA